LPKPEGYQPPKPRDNDRRDNNKRDNRRDNRRDKN